MLRYLSNRLNKEMLFTACSQLCFGMLGALLVQMVVLPSVSPSIATVQVTALVDSFVRETAQQSLSPAERQQKVALFGNLLNQTINRIAKQKHVVLVPAEAVMAGGIDVTQAVADQVKRGMAA